MSRRTTMSIGIAAVGAAVAAFATPALAIPSNILSLTITPSTALVNGQSVQVSATGFAPNSPVFVAECSALDVTGAACDQTPAHIVATQADAAGALATTFTVFTGAVGNGECAAVSDNCVLVATDNVDPNAVNTVAYNTIEFGSAPAATTPSVSAKSTKDAVAKGEKFAVKGLVSAASYGVPGLKVKLYQRDSKSDDWSKVDSTTTGDTGKYKFGGLTQKRAEQYQVRSVKGTVADVVYNAAKSKVVKVGFDK